ncbi:aminoacyl-histidine dipeptidase [Moheibacter sediminis]|uniref:Cytosol non-specific dipeptidase n=1 Tax=Moheibacter sediminis TaxID=1434700 RepID=A0A1W1ZBG9_9FLAO|nr:aminoacyl-histidine dipeptidase [Moheibacter sediminis]SMC45686.1 dipeptidase D [Moheibacter sediminis]
MNEILSLEPQNIWKNFSKLNEVPRPSKKEEKVIQFMVDFGKNLNLETIVDKVGNVIIKKSASAGMENRKTVVLQSHLDMVHQKNNDVNFDFETQGIQMYIDTDGFVKAKGTTLGADNGIGVATIMAVLESTQIEHPAIEALFTIDEETGMTGAIELDETVIQGEILLNLDTEEDDELTMGCAGGLDVTATKKYSIETLNGDFSSVKVDVKGLKGGHSGGDIHLGLGNSNKILARFLNESLQFKAQIASMNSGSLRNAIPREGHFIISASTSEVENLKSAFETLKNDIHTEFQSVEPNLKIEISNTEFNSYVASFDETKKFTFALLSAYNGVYRMSPEIEGLTETSNNVANVVVGNGEMKILCLTRSALDSNKKLLSETLKSTFELADFTVTFSGGYPGWRPNTNSEIVKLMEKIYTEKFNESPKISATHGGLECGIIGGHYPNLDMISFGPNIYGAHSPDERVEIKSVQKFWNYFLEVLKQTPEKN